MRVTVLGASGHIGGVVCEALEKLTEVEIVRSSRRRGGVDLLDPSSFRALDDSDFVINCTDTYTTLPDTLYEYCARGPGVLLETTADTRAYVRMREIVAAIPEAERHGTLVPGVGVFPGLSNLAVAEWVQRHRVDSSVDLELSWSVLSGAGAGTCEVMVRSLSEPRIVLAADGEQQEAPPLGAVRRTGFAGQPAGLELGLPESVLLPLSLGIPACRTFAAVRPRSPKFVLSFTAYLARLGLFGWPGVPTLSRFAFGLLRGRLLRRRTTSLQMRVVAGNDSQANDGVLELHLDDAFAAAGYMIAASISLLRESPSGTGVQPIELHLTLDQLLQQMELMGFQGVNRVERE